MKTWLAALFERDSVRRAVRTFIITFLTVLIPGLLDWLNDVTKWAGDHGQSPFPAASSVAYVGISAIIAGLIAVVNLVWNAVEDATGKGLLRKVDR